MTIDEYEKVLVDEETINRINKAYEHEMKTIYNKLVRDRIPELIEKSGRIANYRVLTKDEYKQALKDKLVEEVNEFLAAQTKDEMREEVADIKEVITAISKTFNLKGRGTNSIKYTKSIEKGVFDKRYFLESVEELPRVKMRIRCKKCGDVIESKYRHDMVWCSCGAVAIDGGNDYVKISGLIEDFEQVIEQVEE